jgi:hypothetical protein
MGSQYQALWDFNESETTWLGKAGVWQIETRPADSRALSHAVSQGRRLRSVRRDSTIARRRIRDTKILTQSFLINELDQLSENVDRLRLTIFQQYWWLKIARGSAPLKEVQLHDSNGVVIGSLPYIVQRNALGVEAPHLSRVSGPIVSKHLGDKEKAIVFGRLIRKLPNISFTFSISKHIPDAHLIREAFKNAGFECFEQINYSQPREDAKGRLGKKLSQHIKQAHNKL